MGCAVVSTESWTVVNLIVAEPTDDAPDGCILVALSSEPCDIGWTYDQATGAILNPNPPPPDDEVAG